VDVLVIPKERVHWVSIVDDGELRDPEFPCVGIEWLEACVTSGECRFPIHYAYNYLDIKPRKREKSIARLMAEKERRVS
jgi:hypothetical protein